MNTVIFYNSNHKLWDQTEQPLPGSETAGRTCLSILN